MRLKHRLSVSLTLVTALVLGVSFLIATLLVKREETDDLDRAILVQATLSAYLVMQRSQTSPSVDDGAGEIPELPMLARRYEAIYAPDGKLLSVSRTFGGLAPRYEQFELHEPLPHKGTLVELTVGDTPLRGVMLPFGDDRRFRLLYALSRRPVDDDLRFLIEVFVVLFLSATGLTAMFSRWLGARLSGDVDAIADVARAVTSGDLDARVRGRATGSLELRALGADMDRMIGQLGALMATQRTFVSHAAHELRSPLATLRGELQLALRRPRSADEYRDTIAESLGEVELLIALAEDLLVLARLQSDTLRRESSCSLGDALNDALRMSRGFADAQGVAFQLPDSLPPVFLRGARPDLARAIRNLLDNAVSHSPTGGVVAVDAVVRDGTLALSISDQGPGVPAQDIPHIFSAFYRGSKDQSEGKGTGLGLAIVREILRGVGGRVYVDPDHPAGACFVLEIPTT